MLYFYKICFEYDLSSILTKEWLKENIVQFIIILIIGFALGFLSSKLVLKKSISHIDKEKELVKLERSHIDKEKEELAKRENEVNNKEDLVIAGQSLNENKTSNQRLLPPN